MNWSLAIEAVTKQVVKIETPTGHGTGFVAFYNQDLSWCGIATAAHVVGHAEEWQQPIRIRHEGSEAPTFLKPDQRVIFLDRPRNSAIVLFLKGELQLPEIPIALLPMDQPCPIGVDVGWLGYPAIEPNTLCFFAGTVSARQVNRRSYLIDGVAIHGVSGGPVFHCPTPTSVQVIGCVSAYQANRATGEALPGLLTAQDVSQFHDVLTWVRNIDEANAAKREFESAQEQGTDPPPDAQADAAPPEAAEISN